MANIVIELKDHEREFLIELVGHCKVVDFHLVDKLVRGDCEFEEGELLSIAKMLEGIPRTEIVDVCVGKFKGPVKCMNTAGTIFFRINNVLGVTEK